MGLVDTGWLQPSKNLMVRVASEFRRKYFLTLERESVSERWFLKVYLNEQLIYEGREKGYPYCVPAKIAGGGFLARLKRKRNG